MKQTIEKLWGSISQLHIYWIFFLNELLRGSVIPPPCGKVEELHVRVAVSISSELQFPGGRISE